MTLKVIGAGFGRTGTDSMREALNILGFGPCHHMRETRSTPEQLDLWRALARGAEPDWPRLFAGYHSSVDWPSSHYWRQLMLAYPDAKILLTYRSPESWWTSFEHTILASIKQRNDPESLGRMLIFDQVFSGRADDRAHAIAIYNANIEAVRATVPADRLIQHAVGDGWEPICKGLGVPIPDQPYPQANSTEEFRARMAQRQAEAVSS